MRDSVGQLVYVMPCKPGALYINITDKCLNSCLFCIKRKGPLFFGCDLSLNNKQPTSVEIADSLFAIPDWFNAKEIVFCGMGEPLLRYECVKDVCYRIKESKPNAPKIRVDTSGLFWAQSKRLDILKHVDVLSVSLNAENAEKYEELCRPKIDRAYGVLMDFLQSVKKAESESNRHGSRFPVVRLSVVDTSEQEFIPAPGHKGYRPGTFPVPDFDACRRIAVDFGWPLVVKRLFRDSCDSEWNDPYIQEMCARGIPLDMCRNCSYKH